jgi:hypothetical protein
LLGTPVLTGGVVFIAFGDLLKHCLSSLPGESAGSYGGNWVTGVRKAA